MTLKKDQNDILTDFRSGRDCLPRRIIHAIVFDHHTRVLGGKKIRQIGLPLVDRIGYAINNKMIVFVLRKNNNNYGRNSIINEICTEL